MEDILRPIYQERASHKETLAVLLLEKNKPHSSWTDHFDAVLIVIVETNERSWFAKHYEYESKKAAMHIITEQQLKDWLAGGRNRRILQWILNGKIIFERNEYIEQLRADLRDFPKGIRSKKINTEFAKLIRSYTIGKDLYDSGEYFDAYNQMVRSLHHLARLAVLEQGFHPEVTVWNQVKQIEPEIYKLYEELIESDEPLDKRIELLLIASGFAIRARTEEGSQHILNVLASKDEGWTFGELIERDELKDYVLDLGVLIEHLIDKGLISVMKEPTKGEGIYHRKYVFRKDE